MFPISVDHGGTDEKNIKEKLSTDARETGVEGFEPLGSEAMPSTVFRKRMMGASSPDVRMTMMRQ